MSLHNALVICNYAPPPARGIAVELSSVFTFLPCPRSEGEIPGYLCYMGKKDSAMKT